MFWIRSTDRHLTVFGKLYGCYTYLVTYLALLCHIYLRVWSPTVTCDMWLVSSYLLNRDECHMWGRKCSLFLDHLISLYLYIHFFYFVNNVIKSGDFWQTFWMWNFHGSVFVVSWCKHRNLNDFILVIFYSDHLLSMHVYTLINISMEGNCWLLLVKTEYIIFTVRHSLFARNH